MTALAASRPASPSSAAGTPVSTGLRALLRERFGHDAFRPHQEDICTAVAQAQDALVVMPTGAGKSLCYQLPGLYRRQQSQGVVVVVSPLIALMDDQVGKLQQLGFSASRIHSGCAREDSREACRKYLKGELDFLFFAPERLAVPGFPELLARRTPALIAVDEAHCISHWGHDFRPEYRMLGERLPGLRPAPVLALTATATPTVQDDIVHLLGLGRDRPRPKDEAGNIRVDDDSGDSSTVTRFIHGFRRENIALEVVDCAPTQRRALAAMAVADESQRPAILYAPTRKDAEEIAADFAEEGLACAAYHAGLPPKQREAVQNGFLKGALEVVVATIAFGMGVDKADVRTVVHFALPSSLEAYSQEVGRAGRDGKPSRALLLGSMVDSKMHAFFLSRDYPESKVLGKVWRALDDDDAIDEESLRRRSGLNHDTFPKALEKLWIHGGAIGVGEKWQRGHQRWEKPYELQRRHKETQISGMTRFLDDKGCRQLALLKHFGDDDDRGACGICDACDPKSCRLRERRAVTDEEAKMVRAIEARLRSAGDRGIGTGKLFSESLEGMGVDRRSFEHLLSAMVRAERVAIEERTFENQNGERIRYQSARLTATVNGDGNLEIFVSARAPGGPATKKSGRGGTGTTDNRRPKPRRTRQDADWAGADHGLVDRLRAWRLAESQRQKIPAFAVFSDRVLLALASQRPTTVEALASISGLRKNIVSKQGSEILQVLQTD